MRPGETRRVKLDSFATSSVLQATLVVDEATWRELRNAAESERSTQGRASVNALLNRLIAGYLAKRRGKGGP